MKTSLGPSQPTSLQEATRKSILEWKANLKSLFEHPKGWFPDVVWEFTAEGDHEDKVLEEVWGHKALIYVRSRTSVHHRHFSFKSDLLSGSNSVIQSRSDGILRIRAPIDPTTHWQFSKELRYFYTGQSTELCLEAPESRSHEPWPEDDTKDVRIDQFRKDLFLMWHSCLCSDVRILITDSFSSPSLEETATVYSAHKFILASRCPYFYDALVSWSKPKSGNDNELCTLSLPSPPFTPSSLHFILGFIYTGTLKFSDQNYDLDTAFAILRSAMYLSLDTLCDEIQVHIVHEKMHGLYHAFLSSVAYVNLTGGKWGTGGCRCNQCALCALRMLEFAVASDVRNYQLYRGAWRALVNLFGDGWCTEEFASLPQKLREGLLKSIGKQITPKNVFPLLFAAERAFVKLKPITDPWGDIVRAMIESCRRGVDDLLCSHTKACFSQVDWLEIMENDDDNSEDGEQVEWTMESLLRGMNDKNAPMLYQTLTSSVLVRLISEKRPTLKKKLMRLQVQQTLLDILARIRGRWSKIRQVGGFDDIDGWSTIDISKAISIPVEDLRSLSKAVRDPVSDAISRVSSWFDGLPLNSWMTPSTPPSSVIEQDYAASSQDDEQDDFWNSTATSGTTSKTRNSLLSKAVFPRFRL